MHLRKFVTHASKAGGIASTLGLVMALSLQFVSGAAQSQTSYPNRPVNLIVPVPPGGILDTVARMVVPSMSQTLGQPVVIDNKAGASGNIAASFVAKSAPDGNTVLMGANTMLIASQLYKNANFNPLKDFAPVSMAAWGTLMLVAHHDELVMRMRHRVL